MSCKYLEGEDRGLYRGTSQSSVRTNGSHWTVDCDIGPVAGIPKGCRSIGWHTRYRYTSSLGLDKQKFRSISNSHGEQSPIVSQFVTKIPTFYGNHTVHYIVQKCPSLHPITCHIIRVHDLVYIFRIHFNINLTSTNRSPRYLFLHRFLTKFLYSADFILHELFTLIIFEGRYKLYWLCNFLHSPDTPSLSRSFVFLQSQSMFSP
jgi:hypothetical protein